MSVRKPQHRMSVAEYLEWEKSGDVRHEYLDGEVYAMAGATRRHNRVANNLNIQLSLRLRGGPCQVFISDIKVYIEALNFFYYPDLAVTCDSEDNDEYTIKRPVLVVEVESSSTFAIDRREKLMAYRKIESLREYLMLSLERISGLIYRRDSDGSWSSEQPGLDSELRLDSVNISLPLASLYEGVVLSEQGSPS